MANVLTNLAADIYKAADTVGRELTGFIPSVTVNADGSERVAIGDVVRSHFTRSATAVDITASMTIPEGTDQTVDNKTMTITKAKAVQIPWTGEDIRHVNNGSGFETIYGDQIRQAMRTLTNAIEVDLGVAAKNGASRAIGTAGTTPFASNFDVIAQGRQILVDNGCPMDNRATFVMNTLAGTKMRNLASLQQVNTAGGDDLLRRGTLLDLQQIMIKESANVAYHTKGTGASYQANGAVAVGGKTVTVDTGSGTVLAGDVVTFAADTTNKYIVGTGIAAAGSLILNETGVLTAIPDDNAMTIGNSYTANVMFHQSAIELVMRPYSVPNGGDAAVDSMLVQDPFSGLVFEIRVYKGYKKAMFEVSAAWGVKVWKPDFVATIMG